MSHLLYSIYRIFISCFFVSIFFSISIAQEATIYDRKIEYEHNLSTFKELIKHINTYFFDTTLEKIQISDYYSNEFVFYSYPAGEKKGVVTSKVDYINGFNQMKKMGISLNIDHCVYLPGLDKVSYTIDGSVRVYYGATLSANGKDVDFSGYQTIDFDQGKILAIWEWADYGGVENHLLK
jgi:hypothetical protein